MGYQRRVHGECWTDGPPVTTAMTCDIGRFVPRWILSTFNFIILLATFLVLVVSVLMVTLPGHTLDLLLYIISRPSLDLPQLTQQSLAENLSPGLVSGLGWLVLLSSLAFTIPALTGYVGAVRESRFCLILYLSPLILIWSSQLTFLILLPVIKNQLYSIVSSLARHSLHHYTEKQDVNVLTFLWNLVMVQLECCGVSSHQDFQDTQLWARERDNLQVLPSACCVLESDQYPLSPISPVDTHCTSVPTKYNSVWMEGCLPKLSSLASDYTSMIILVIISVLTVEILVIILACCLCFLQKYRGDKNCHRIIVTKQTSQPQPERKTCLHDERRNLIYSEAVSDGVP